MFIRKVPGGPPDGVQRGSVLDLTLYPGDPLSPGWASEPGSKRLPLSEAKTIMKIPVLPISYADAQPLLASLNGPVAPEAWRGALPITYHLGPGANVHLKVAMDKETRPLYDVIARIPGSEFSDQWVLDGKHHDAWVHGASDPLSGAVPLMETARTLAEITRNADGSPNAPSCLPRVLGCRRIRADRIDRMGGGACRGADTETRRLPQCRFERQRQVQREWFAHARSFHAGSVARRSRSRQWQAVNGCPDGKTRKSSGRTGRQRRVPHQPARVRGSDYTPFLQHLGVASLDIHFASDDAGVYHSAYDDFNWYSHFSDTTFVYGRTLSQVHANRRS